jgi:soluble lytic murein transglycosylase-like protein
MNIRKISLNHVLLFAVLLAFGWTVRNTYFKKKVVSAAEFAVEDSDDALDSCVIMDNQEPSVRYNDCIKVAAARNGLNPKIVWGYVKSESDFDPKAVSASGAIGLMQILQKECPGYDLHDERQNLRCGTRYMARQLLVARGDVNQMLMLTVTGSSDLLAARLEHPQAGPVIRNFARRVQEIAATAPID